MLFALDGDFLVIPGDLFARDGDLEPDERGLCWVMEEAGRGSTGCATTIASSAAPNLCSILDLCGSDNGSGDDGGGFWGFFGVSSFNSVRISVPLDRSIFIGSMVVRRGNGGSFWMSAIFTKPVLCCVSAKLTN